MGQLSGTLGQNVTKRVVGSFSHRMIVDARIIETMALYTLGAIGALRRRPNSRALEALTGAPLLLLFAQSYGGEGLLRAVLFGLPFISLLAASALLPNRVGPIQAILPKLPFGVVGRKTLGVTVAIVILVFSVGTVVVRGGNDAFESYTLGEFDAVNYTYNHIAPGQTLGVVIENLPIGYRDVGSITVFDAEQNNQTSLPVRPSTFVSNHAAWIILSQSQESWGVNIAGFPRGWEEKLETALLSDGYKIAKAWPTATVLRAPSSIVNDG